MKILALDLGDVWVGTAMSDPLRIIATPYKTIKTTELLSFLKILFTTQKINVVLIGYPKTLKDTESEQTKKVVSQKELLEKEFPEKNWILRDERLSSKHARTIQGKKAKSEGPQEHSIAAALILETYLNFLKQ